MNPSPDNMEIKSMPSLPDNLEEAFLLLRHLRILQGQTAQRLLEEDPNGCLANQVVGDHFPAIYLYELNREMELCFEVDKVHHRIGQLRGKQIRKDAEWDRRNLFKKREAADADGGLIGQLAKDKEAERTAAPIDYSKAQGE